MSDDDELELEALQRQLDDAFHTTRPRAGFDDELWSRIQGRRPAGRLLQRFFAGIVGSVQRAPLVAAGAVAAVLIVAISLGVLSLGGLRGGGSTASLATREQAGSSQYNGAVGAFGKLPVPASVSSQPKATSPLQPAAGPSSSDVYFGPVRLVWVGRLNVGVSTAPVYRYAEPSAADADRFAASLGAKPEPGQPGPGILGLYFGDSFTLEIIGSNNAPTREPFFAILPVTSNLPPPSANPADTAARFLNAHGLTPVWPFVVAVDQGGVVTRVMYQRQFDVTSYGRAFLVDGFGERYGLEVDLHSNGSLQASGPLPLNLDSAGYPIISGDAAVRSALSLSPAGATSNPSIPTVRLTSAELVYALVLAGDHSFYEPAYLFSGTFSQNGVTYVKRVLVPAIDPTQRLP